MILLIIIFLLLGPAVQAANVSAVDKTTSTCLNLPHIHIPGVQILSIASRVVINGTVLESPPTLNHDVHNIDVCEVNVTLSHFEADDSVLVQTWLPLRNWNTRFVAIGGGAWIAGQGAVDLAMPATSGYAVSSTDAGLTGASPGTPGGWALNEDGKINTALLTNFASRSIHDMAVVGKAVTYAFYGRRAKRSYWNGCSTGGRQGLVAAQKYPGDFDGISAGAPAIYWTEYVVAELWPQVVMKEADYYPLPCEFATIVAKAVEACDGNDKVMDGVITDPSKCTFDPFTLVGMKAQCEGISVIITAKSASIVRKIWDGPKTPQGSSLWFGVPKGASLGALADTGPRHGINGPAPFFLAEQWVQFFVKQNPNFDVTALNTTEFVKVFAESKSKFDGLIGSANPDLSAFRASGGKLLVWHGLADQLIYPQDSIKYLKEVERKVGGAELTSEFFRLFLAPGVDHCGYGAGPPFPAGAPPVDPFSALVSWVENGTAPEELYGETLSTAPMHFGRKICKYPLKPKYRGCGDTNIAASYTCR